MSGASFDVVVPTLGRSSLAALLEGLAAADAPLPGRIVLVADAEAGLQVDVPGRLAARTTVVHGPSAGPAAARNAGWRATSAEWVAFLDDDVVPERDWLARLADDLGAAGADVGGSQGVIRVPLPAGRRPTDWERNVKGLERARWATADMAYRRAALTEVGGFDERFPRAYREDADLAIRVAAAGWRLVAGTRTVVHPVRDADPWISVRLQAGNADDVLMRALHGRDWRSLAGAPPGRARRHAAVSAAGLLAVLLTPARRPRLAALPGLAWLAGMGELAWARIAPGPRTAREIATMLATSAAIPPAATFHRIRALVRLRAVLAGRERAARPSTSRPDAVLLDRDGTLVVDVPYNGDPDRVVAMPGAREALDRLREAGVPTAVVSNQSGVARGLTTMADVETVSRRAEELLGPLGPWFFCPHLPDAGCGCRKPSPGLIVRAAAALGVSPERCAVIGDIGADVEAARAAGARGVLVPTAKTRPEEVAGAPEVAPDLPTAVDLLIGGER